MGTLELDVGQPFVAALGAGFRLFAPRSPACGRVDAVVVADGLAGTLPDVVRAGNGGEDQADVAIPLPRRGERRKDDGPLAECAAEFVECGESCGAGGQGAEQGRAGNGGAGLKLVARLPLMTHDEGFVGADHQGEPHDGSRGFRL